MKKNNKSFKLKFRRFSFSIVCLLITGTLGFSVYNDMSESSALKADLRRAKVELNDLSKKKEALVLEEKKLTDPAYVENYARGTHRLSKDDEQVFILPKGE